KDVSKCAVMGESEPDDAAGAWSGIEVELLIKVAQMGPFEILSRWGAERAGRDDEAATSSGKLVACGAGCAGMDGVYGEIGIADAGIAGYARKTCRQRSVKRFIRIRFKSDGVDEITIRIHIGI